MREIIIFFTLCIFLTNDLSATEYHVSKQGKDTNEGSVSAPFLTISRASEAAFPGDTITVHEGTYREWIKPVHGGGSDALRIVYRAAPGENVVIKGSEVVTGWKKVQNDTWQVVLPNTFFGNYNPFDDPINGDWFDPMGRVHHTGAVYLNEHWLTEAVALEEVLKPVSEKPDWLTRFNDRDLLNVAFFRMVQERKISENIYASDFNEQEGVRIIESHTEGNGIGYIDKGDWVSYKGVDCGKGTRKIGLRVASGNKGGIIEIRLDKPDGELMGICSIGNTGGWDNWQDTIVAVKKISGNQDLCLVFKSHKVELPDQPLWFATVDEKNTTIWAQFEGLDPNKQLVEVNVRKAVFYPEQPFVNYITVQGFTMKHAATQWAPPTAEQIGLIGTHWSKGWIIEDNDISYSVCTGITLGKYGDEYDNKSANSAEGYVATINRALKNGWNMETVGSHIVRNNTISHCEQAGLVGSMGAIFSTVTGNTIHDIHQRKLFSGAEMAGIKFHGAIDAIIEHNHIYQTSLGLWLDWMAQGTRVSCNLFHDNQQDVFLEVNHGPYVLDNNIFLSSGTVSTVSRGGAYVHNLFTGNISIAGYDSRLTPFHPAHSTKVAGLHDNPRGDERYYNNIFVNSRGLAGHNEGVNPVFMGGNVFLGKSEACIHEESPLVLDNFDPEIKLVEKEDGYYLEFTFDSDWIEKQKRDLITSDLLGKAKIPDLPYENRDGSQVRVDTDYSGKQRNKDNPFPGPFVVTQNGKQMVKVWPVSRVNKP